MKATICDHCGEICSEEVTKLVVGTPIVRKMLFFGTERDVDFENYELCENCASLFRKWLLKNEEECESELQADKQAR